MYRKFFVCCGVQPAMRQFRQCLYRLLLMVYFLTPGASILAHAASTSLPTISIGFPPNGVTVSGQTYITLNSGFNLPFTGAEKQRLYLDGDLLWSSSGNIDLVEPLLWDTVTATPGTHTLVAAVEDASGNTVTSSPVSVAVSNGSGPDTTAPTKPANLTATAAGCGKVRLSWSGSSDLDGSGVEAYTLFRNNHPYGGITIAADRAWFDDTDDVRAETIYSYYLVAQDFAGNTSPASDTVTVTTPVCILADAEEVFDSADRQISGRAVASSDTREALVYQKINRFTGRYDSYLQLKDEDTGATSNFPLQSNAYETDYLLTSPTSLMTLTRTDSGLSVDQYKLDGSPIPTSATLVSTRAFGDANSCPKSLFQLASGAIMAAWTAECGDYGSTTYMQLNIAYRNPAGIWVDPLVVSLSPDDWKERIAIAQHPADGSIWVFNLADTTGRIGASHFTESPNGLSLDWTNPRFIAAGDASDNIQDGSNAAGDEYAFLIAAPDPFRNSIDLAYQSNDNVWVYVDPLFQAGNGIFMKQNPIAVAHIGADGTKAFNISPAYTERVAYFGLSVLDDGTIWLAYFPIDPQSLTWNQIHAVRYANGAWSAPAQVGSDLNSIYNWSNSGPQWDPGFLISRADRPRVAFRAPDSKIHAYRLAVTTSAPDTIPPSTPGNLVASNVTSTSVDLTWLASTDDVGVTGYNVYRCEGTGCAPVKVGTTSGTVYEDASLVSAATYTYTVAAYDSGGNVSSLSAPISVSLDASGTSPTCTAAAPRLSLTPASQSGDPGQTLEYTVSLVNNDGVACTDTTFDLTITALPAGWDGSLSTATLSLSPGAAGTATLSVSSALASPAGSYTVQLGTIDAAEVEHVTSTTATYVVNPLIPIGDTEAPTAPSSLTATENANQVSLSWLASSDNVGVAGYRVYRDDVLIADTVDVDYMDLDGVDGVIYEYSIAAYDLAGNVSPRSDPVSAGKTKTKAKGQGGGKGKGPNK